MCRILTLTSGTAALVGSENYSWEGGCWGQAGVLNNRQCVEMWRACGEWVPGEKNVVIEAPGPTAEAS